MDNRIVRQKLKESFVILLNFFGSDLLLILVFFYYYRLLFLEEKDGFVLYIRPSCWGYLEDSVLRDIFFLSVHQVIQKVWADFNDYLLPFGDSIKLAFEFKNQIRKNIHINFNNFLAAFSLITIKDWLTKKHPHFQLIFTCKWSFPPSNLPRNLQF